MLAFLSTLSLRRATRPDRLWRAYHGNFYPRSPCGERRSGAAGQLTSYGFLSTLSLRRATTGWLSAFAYRRISIHALLAESDLRSPNPRLTGDNFYPRSPCGERHFRSTLKRAIADFYPRSPCGERPVVNNIVFVPGKFLSTLSLRRATPKRLEIHQ